MDSLSGKGKTESSSDKHAIEAARAASLSVARNLAPVNLPKASKSKICCGLNPRALVSKKKLRFVSADVDLDLSYVTDNVIAMGWPSVGIEALYRNPVTQVRSFLEDRHSGHYRIWNLCVERDYVSTALGFKCEVERFCWYDHCPPPFAMMKPLCDSLHSWTRSDPKNVAVVHCKAGKGRTGTVIAAFLVHSKQAPTAEASLGIFGWRRTRNGRGVTLPGQLRYVAYYSMQVTAIREDEAAWPDPCPPPLPSVLVAQLNENTSPVAVVEVALTSPTLSPSSSSSSLIANAEPTLTLLHHHKSMDSVDLSEAVSPSVSSVSSETKNDPLFIALSSPLKAVTSESDLLPLVAVNLSPMASSITSTLNEGEDRQQGGSSSPRSSSSSPPQVQRLHVASSTSNLSVVEGSLSPEVSLDSASPVLSAVEESSSSSLSSPSSPSEEVREIAAQRLANELLSDEKFPATAACIQSTPDLDDPASNVLTIILHRDSERGVGFSLAPDLAGRPVICYFPTKPLGEIENAPAYSAHAAARSEHRENGAIGKGYNIELGLVAKIFELGDEIRRVNDAEVSQSMHFDHFIALLRDATDPLTLLVFRRTHVGHSRRILPPVTPEEYKSRISRAIGPWAAGSDARTVPAPAIRIVSVSLSDSPRLPGLGRFAKMASRCGGSDGKCGMCVRCLEWLCSDGIESGSDDEEDEIEEYLYEGGGDPRREGLYIQVLGGEFCRDILFDSRTVEAFAASAKGAGIGAIHGGRGGSEAVPEWGPNRAQRRRIASKKASMNSPGARGKSGYESAAGAGVVSSPRPEEDEDEDDDEGFAAASASSARNGFAPPKPMSRKARKQLRSRQNLLLKSLSDNEAAATPSSSSSRGLASRQSSFFIPNKNASSSSSSSLARATEEKDSVGIVVNDDQPPPSSFFRFDPATGPIEDTEAAWGSAYFSQELSVNNSPSGGGGVGGGEVSNNRDGSSGPATLCVRGDFKLIVRCIGRKKPLAALWLHTAFLPLPLSLQQCLDDELCNVQTKARSSDRFDKSNDDDDVDDKIVDVADIDVSSINDGIMLDQNNDAAEHVIGPMPTGTVLPGCPTLGAVFSAAGAFTSGSSLSSSSQRRGASGGAASSASSTNDELEKRIQRSSIGCAVFGKNELDGVSKDRKHRVWPQDVQLSITYSLLGVPASEGGAQLPHFYLRSVMKE